VKGIKRRIDLGPAVLTVEWADEAAMRDFLEAEADEETPDGCWDDEGKRILLHVRLKKRPRYARQILLHEVAHAVLDLYHEVS
jgi:hypothetical protein